MRLTSPRFFQCTSTSVPIVCSLFVAASSFGADVITSFMSPIVSYQYPNDFSSEALADGGISSRILSYQYFEWPGDSILGLQSSPMVSYFYLSWSTPPNTLSSSSVVTVSPSSVPADGSTPATVTVTLLDGNGNPVPGKTIKVSAVEVSPGLVTSGHTVLQPTQPTRLTDANGQVTAQLTSTLAGTAVVSVQDVSDGVGLLAHPKVQFEAERVVPGQELANAITQLANSSGNLLTHSIASAAMDEGVNGDYFWNSAGEDMISGGLTVLDTVGSQMWLDMSDGGEEEAKTFRTALKPALIALIHDNNVFNVEETINLLTKSSTGLSDYAKAISDNNTVFQQTEESAAGKLLLGVPAVAANYSARYVSDIALRVQANDLLGQVVSSQDGLILAVKDMSQASHSWWLAGLFLGVDISTAAASALVPVAKPITSGIGIGAADVQLASAARSLSIDQQGYNSACVSLAGSSYLSCLLDANTEAALNNIALGQPPAPVTGRILSAVDSKRLYEPATGVVGSIEGWLWKTFANTKVVQTVGASSTISISNPGLLAAQYCAYAFFTNTVDLVNDAGVIAGSTKVPIVVAQINSIPGGQSEQITLDYFGHPTRGIPDAGTTIRFSVLGYDGKGGLFAVDEATSTMVWQLHSSGPVAQDAGTNMVSVETLIRSLVYPNPTNQTYQAHIWVVNPFAVPLLATVTQPLPPGTAVVSTDGLLWNDSIVWTNTVATNGSAEQSFSFTFSVPPGAETNLPPPTLMFSDGTGTNSLTKAAAAATFLGLLPVGVSSVIPSGTWGVDTVVQLTVTNFTAGNQAGSLAISLMDSKGNAVTNFSLAFSVRGLAGTNLTYSMPGTIQVGSYSLVGTLTINGGTAQVVSGTYVVPLPRTMLSLDSTALATTNSFTIVLRGPPGFNFLLEASTNLVDWTPIQYFESTDPVVYCTDSALANSQTRFYRALTVAP